MTSIGEANRSRPVAPARRSYQQGTVRRRAPLILLLVMLTGCSREEPEVRYRLTVHVETPSGSRRGSGVIGLTARDQRSILSPTGHVPLTIVNGEAIPIDLPGGRTLFMLLGRVGDVDQIIPMLRNAKADGGRDTSVPPTALPSFVTFDDPKSPTSVVGVDPNALARIFGSGYALRHVTVRLTDLPITYGASPRLPWLTGMDSYLTGKHVSSASLAGELSSLHFRRLKN